MTPFRYGDVIRWCIAAGLALFLIGCSEQRSGIAELAGKTMGTGYSVKLSPPPSAPRREELQRRITQRLDTINRQMSTYDPESDLMRFNRAPAGAWTPVPQGLVTLVEKAREISEISDGIYDVTIGPLVNLWGFGNTGRRDAPPAPAQIAAVLEQVGYEYLDTRVTPPAMRKGINGLQVDLSSIAKGWAVDEIARLLEGLGYEDYLVEIGGELRARGLKASGEPWRIAIEQPLPDRRDVQRIVALHDTALATSGDYRNFFEDAGRHYSHTIDPKTGTTVRHRLASVTVFADDCATADAWATALMALGDQRGPALARSRGLRAMFIVRGADGLHEQVSPALQQASFWPGS